MSPAVIALPPARGTASALPREVSDGKAASLAAPQLLVVDDEPDLREMLQLVLEAEGYRVSVATDGKHAFELIDAGLEPELIVLDLMMPRMNGWEVWDRLQLSPHLSRIPVVVFTATGLGPGSIGGAHVMPKSSDAAVLLAKIAQLLGHD